PVPAELMTRPPSRPALHDERDAPAVRGAGVVVAAGDLARANADAALVDLVALGGAPAREPVVRTGRRRIDPRDPGHRHAAADDLAQPDAVAEGGPVGVEEATAAVRERPGRELALQGRNHVLREMARGRAHGEHD